MQDISRCRTPDLGGQTWLCEHCDTTHYSYHSCRNRHCPKCQNDRNSDWLQKQLDLLLPVPYFMATITVPDGLRTLFRRCQRKMYHLLFKTSAEAIMRLAKDPKYLGADIGLVGVLQTWARNLVYHPHIHFLIPGGGITKNGKRWKWANPNFFIHVKPLSRLIRGTFRKALTDTGLFDKVPSSVWKHEWVCHIEPVGTGQSALKYLTPYIFRVAISNNNILSLKQGKVTFRYKDGDSKTFRLCALWML